METKTSEHLEQNTISVKTESKQPGEIYYASAGRRVVAHLITGALTSIPLINIVLIIIHVYLYLVKGTGIGYALTGLRTADRITGRKPSWGMLFLRAIMKYLIIFILVGIGIAMAAQGSMSGDSTILLTGAILSLLGPLFVFIVYLVSISQTEHHQTQYDKLSRVYVVKEIGKGVSNSGLIAMVIGAIVVFIILPMIIFSLVVSTSLSSARSVASDAVTISNMQQLALGLELERDLDGNYMTARDINEIQVFGINTRSLSEDGVRWLDNTNTPREFCAYVTIEDEFYVISEQGSRYADETPLEHSDC